MPATTGNTDRPRSAPRAWRRTNPSKLRVGSSTPCAGSVPRDRVRSLPGSAGRKRSAPSRAPFWNRKGSTDPNPSASFPRRCSRRSPFWVEGCSTSMGAPTTCTAPSASRNARCRCIRCWVAKQTAWRTTWRQPSWIRPSCWFPGAPTPKMPQSTTAASNGACNGSARVCRSSISGPCATPWQIKPTYGFL